jgi:hypothetical protein
MIHALVAPLFWLFACAYEAPYEPNALYPSTNTITGEVVSDVAVSATVIVFLTPAAAPMPPNGTGSPITFTTVPASAFTGRDAGVQSAAFTVSNVPDGEYVLTALMDVDGNFQPLYDALAGGTCGDYVGAHLAGLSSTDLGVVDVAGGELLDDVTVIVASELLFERPAFSLEGFGSNTGGEDDATVDRAQGGEDSTSQVYRLTPTGVHSSMPLELADLGESCGVGFAMYAPDADADGQFDPHPVYGDIGLFDLWPKMFLQYLGTPEIGEGGTVSFSNDLREGESWAAENVPDPTYYPIFGVVAPGQTVLLDGPIDLLWLPGAKHFLPDGTVETETDPSRIPAGAWSMTLISFTGQTWSMPNELPRYESTNESFDPDAQLQWLTVE